MIKIAIGRNDTLILYDDTQATAYGWFRVKRTVKQF